MENKYLDSEAILLKYIIRDNNYDPVQEYKIQLKSEFPSQNTHSAIAVYLLVHQTRHYTVYEFNGIRII